jgi:hypothetical protein
VSKKREKFLRLFAPQREQRDFAVRAVLRGLEVWDPFKDGSSGYIYWLNKAAPIAINLGNGHIQCSKFGLIQDGLISYQPYQPRANSGNAFLGGIRIKNIKSIKLI